MSVERFLSVTKRTTVTILFVRMLAHLGNNGGKIGSICSSIIFSPAKFLSIKAGTE